MALSAFIFDIDGTLIDSNSAHLRAWDLALRKHGYRVSTDRIAVEIGKGGDQLIPSLLGQQIEEKDGESLRTAHTAEFVAIAKSERLRIFPGVEALLAGLRQHGLKVALATSGKKKEVQATERSAGIDWSKLFDVIATGDDASESKPAPGILEAAIRKLNIAPTECAMVGDTPYDADTARDAGAICFGVTCGGMNGVKTLRATGMRTVYGDPADIAAQLDDALRIASPGSAIFTKDVNESLMKEAIAVAREGMERGEVPIGCVIADGDGTILARGHNEMNATQNKIAHAEIVTFNRIAGSVPIDARDLALVATLEPCVMCLGACMEAAVDTILFGLPAPADGGRNRVRPPISPESQIPRILGNVLAEESRALLEAFLKRSSANPAQIAFVQQLLAKT